MNNMRVEIPDDIMKLVSAFADVQTDTVLEHYQNRSQTNAEKIKEDCIVGKLGEFGTYQYFIGRRYACTKPDMNVYGPDDKRFTSDLIGDGNKLCVKSQSVEQAGRFGLSWTFQYGGNGDGHHDKILDVSGKELFVGCMVDGRIVDIKVVMPMGDILQCGMLKDPILKKYHGIKKVLYYKDLRESFDDLIVK